MKLNHCKQQVYRKMNKLSLAVLFILIFTLPNIIASGTVQTGNLNPGSVNLCGNNVQYVTITASNILNKENLVLTSVSAKLYITGNPGLNYITSQSVNLGDLQPLSQSILNPSWTIQCSSPVQGAYIAYVNYTSTNGYKGSSIDEATSTLIISESSQLSGNISITEGQKTESSPENFPIIADNTPTIEVVTNKNAVCKGSLDKDEAYSDMDFIFYGLEKYHNYTFINQVTEGEHSAYVKCSDESNNIMQNSLKINFIVDSKAPEITIASPGVKVVGEFTELKVTVNEKSDCRYEDRDRSFDSMDKFTVISSNTFITQISELEEDAYEYFVKCKDSVGNIAEKKIEFDVSLRPTARIAIEKTPPLSEGTFQVTLIPSKELREVPILSYTFTDDTGFNREISLIKDGSVYRGYMIIEKSEKTRAGEFLFTGTDLEGNEGTEITEGTIFLVDTIKPVAPESFEGKSTEDGIELKWYYTGEKAERYNIYRSIAQGTGYLQYYAYATSDKFTDEDVSQNQLYYYRVGAVDKAGNIGALSNEISVYSQSGNSEEQVVVNTNLATQQTRDWKIKIEKDIDTMLIDLGWAENNLKDISAREASVEELSLIKQVLEAKSEIEKLKTQIKGIDLITISDNDLRETLSRADALVARTKKATPQNLEISKSTNVLQATTTSDIELAISELLKHGNYTEGQIKDYTRRMDKIKDNVKVETELKTLKIEFLDDSTESKILVTKKYSYESPEPLSSVFVVEIIPKTVAGDISSIDLRTPDYSVINEDPVILWRLDKLTFDKQTITYILLSNDNSEAAKSTKTIILVDPSQIIKPSAGIITGFAVIFSKIQNNGIEIFGILLGSVILLGLAMYYFAVVNEVDLVTYVKNLPLIKKKKDTEELAEPAKIPLLNLEYETKLNSTNETQATEIKQVQEPISAKEGGYQEQKTNTEKTESQKTPNFSYLLETDDPLKTIPGQYFFVKNGDVIRSITELSKSLEKMDEFTFYYHVNQNHNDFADWVETIYHNKALADLIRSKSTKENLLGLMAELEH